VTQMSHTHPIASLVIVGVLCCVSRLPKPAQTAAKPNLNDTSLSRGGRRFFNVEMTPDRALNGTVRAGYPWPHADHHLKPHLETYRANGPAAWGLHRVRSQGAREIFLKSRAISPEDRYLVTEVIFCVGVFPRLFSIAKMPDPPRSSTTQLVGSRSGSWGMRPQWQAILDLRRVPITGTQRDILNSVQSLQSRNIWSPSDFSHIEPQSILLYQSSNGMTRSTKETRKMKTKIIASVAAFVFALTSVSTFAKRGRGVATPTTLVAPRSWPTPTPLPLPTPKPLQLNY